MIVRARECGGGGDLIARRKRKSSLLRPLPLFLGSRLQKGGHNSGAVRYNNHSNTISEHLY